MPTDTRWCPQAPMFVPGVWASGWRANDKGKGKEGEDSEREDGLAEAAGARIVCEATWSSGTRTAPTGTRGCLQAPMESLESGHQMVCQRQRKRKGGRGL